MVQDDLSGEAIQALLREHVQGMIDTSPIDSVHTLPIESLRADDVVLWSAWSGDDIAGCGALKALSGESGEVKSMRTADAFRQLGVASLILQQIVAEARQRGYRCLLLETGSAEAFLPAQRFYLKHGFEFRGPFADYTDDPFSRFMQLDL